MLANLGTVLGRQNKLDEATTLLNEGARASRRLTSRLQFPSTTWPTC
jgi:hypothetical protein